jgi:2'-5' RNA ligase
VSDERVRLFVALELPDDVRDVLQRWRSRALSDMQGLRAVDAENLHVTLCFLGSCEAAEIDSIGAACAGAVAGREPCSLALGGALWLPPRRPRVVAVDLDDHGSALASVQASLSDALAAGGWYRPESRPFLAHVTVARVGSGARVRAGELPALDPVAFAGSTVTLYRSRPSPRGARYEPLRRIDLGEASADSVLGAADPVAVVRRFHAEQARAYAGGELERLRALVAEDVVWHVPGRSAIAGEHLGVEAVLAYFDRRRRFTDETFRVTVHSIGLVGDRVVQFAGGRALRAGEEVSWETVGVFRVEGGRLAECWLIPFDQYAFDRIWS